MSGHDDDKTQTHAVLTQGTMVSHYRLIEKIGSGGMGEVYLAEDIKLERKVALKFLPPHLCQDAECRARFTREAQSAAKLDHPNIVSVFEVGEYRGRPFFSMQHVEGRSLKEVIAGKSLPLDQILEIGIQVCEGLRAAHDKGITHRDIKPSNILIDVHGRARIVDFGLASVMGSDHLTKTGSTLGTVGYMSPEQARGEEVDARSDLFSLGVVIFELVAGRSPFKAESDIATVRNIIEASPEPLARYKADVPEELQRIVSKALTKDRSMRYQHADEMLADLRNEKEVQSGRSVPPSAGLTVKRNRRWLWVTVPAAAVIIAVALLQFVPWRETEYVVPKKKQVTLFGDAIMPAISPDGNFLAYVRRNNASGTRIALVQDLVNGSTIKVFEDKSIWDLRWSPDGSEILLSAWNDSAFSMVLVPRLGGSIRRYPIWGTGSTWSPDGNTFAFVSLGRIYFVDKKSGDTSSIAADTGLYNIDWSPNGEFLAMSIGSPTGWYIGAYNIRKKTMQRVTDSLLPINVVWSSKGDAIYFMNDNGENPPDLYKVRVNPRSGKPEGKPIRLLSGLQGGQYVFSVSRDNRKLAVRQRITSVNLWFAWLEGAQNNEPRTIQLTSGTAEIYEVSISPDGRQIAYAMKLQEESHIFTMPIDGGAPLQITHTGTSNRWPTWSPDGNRIAYVTTTGESSGIAVIDATGGVPRLLDNSGYGMYLTWNPGDRLLYRDWGNCSMLDPESGAKDKLMPHDLANGYISSPCFSPDGQRVALLLTEFQGERHTRSRRKNELAVFSVQDHTKLYSSLSDPGTDLLGWSKDGKWLYLIDSDSAKTVISRLQIGGKEKEPVITLPWPDIFDIVMGPECSTFVLVRGQSQSDIWLVENFDPDAR